LKNAVGDYNRKSLFIEDANLFFQGAKKVIEGFCLFFNNNETDVLNYSFETAGYKSMDGWNKFSNLFHFNTLIPSDMYTPYKKYIKDLVMADKGFEDKEVQELISTAHDFETVNNSLTSLRKLWFPQSGKGSQMENEDYYLKLANSMKKIIKNRKDERKKWEEEDE